MPATHLLAYSIPQYVAALSVVLTRYWARFRPGRPYGSRGNDDWVMISALMFATVCFVCYMLQIWLGLGSRVELLEANAATYRQLLMFRFLHQVSVVIALGLVKVSTCLFLQRLVAKNKWYTRALCLVIVIMAALTLVSVGTIVSEPVKAPGDYSLRPPPFGAGNAKCFSLSTFTKIGLGNGIFHIVTDILLALLPIPLVTKLKVTIRVRISLVLILSLGAFAAIAGIVRQTKASPLDEHDAYSIWNFLELHMGMIAASLPSLKKLLAAIWGKIAATTHASTGPARKQNFADLNSNSYSWEADIAHRSPTENREGWMELKTSLVIRKITTVTVSTGQRV